MKKLDKSMVTFIGIIFIIILIIAFVYMNYFRTFTVVFDTKIGAGIQAQEVKVGSTATKPQDPVADGYIFEGWYLDNQEYDFTTPVKGNIVLTAKWDGVE